VDPAQFFLRISSSQSLPGRAGSAKPWSPARWPGPLALRHRHDHSRDRRAAAASPPPSTRVVRYDEIELVRGDKSAGRAAVRGRTITPDLALVEYLEDHGLRRVARRMAATGVLEVVATATPGIKDLLVLGKVKQLEQTRRSDLLVLDAPAAGHAFSFLEAAASYMTPPRSGPSIIRPSRCSPCCATPPVRR